MSLKNKQYRHRHSGEVIQVCSELADGRLEFTSQGGGFVRTMSRETFENDFVEHVIPGYQLGAVTLDMAPEGTSIPAYLNGQRWNGWQTPQFPVASMPQVMELVGCVTYDADRDAYIVKESDDPEDEWVVEAQMIETADGQQVKTYGVGAGSWTWETA